MSAVSGSRPSVRIELSKRPVRLAAVEIEKVGEPQHVVSERLLTIPNVLSILRLLGVPVFLWAILSGHDGLAFLLLLLSGVTDYLDGKIARQFNMECRLGGLLDPIADRLYILATLFGLMWRDIIPVWLVVVLLARELVMAVMLLYLRSPARSGCRCTSSARPRPSTCSTPSPCCCSHRDDWIGDLARPIGWGFAWWGVVLYWLAAVLYVRRPSTHGRSRDRARRVPGRDATGAQRPGDPDESMTPADQMMERPLDPGYQEAAARRAAAGLPPATSTRTVLVIVLAILTGFLFAVAAQSPAPEAHGGRRGQEGARHPHRGAAEARRPSRRPRSAISASRSVTPRPCPCSSPAAQTSPPRSRTSRLQAGAVPLKGPGLTLTLDDAA